MMDDPVMNKSQNSFPVDRPTEALIRDHNMFRTLVDAYFNSDSEAVKINAAEQILMLMETHSLLEESVFYPAVREVDPTLIGHFKEEHQRTDEMLVALKGMGLNNAEALPLFEELIDMHLQHVQEEEKDFFPKLEQSNIDMTPIGLQMQAYEANLVHIQAQANQQGARK
jgi:hypothetical protein